MAFHVTQCPGCDSTFNTNARILQSAAGKVRCGSCLTVFEAVDNFISINDAEEDEDSSVFVGNDPADYFDPTQFITRSALTAPDPVDEAILTTLAQAAAGRASQTVPEIAQHNTFLKTEAAALNDAGVGTEAIPEKFSLEEADFLTAVAAELAATPAAIELENETVLPSHDAVVETPQYDEQEFLVAPLPAEALQEAQEESAAPASTETVRNETAEPETGHSTAMPTVFAQPLAHQPAPEAIRLHASFSLYHRVSESTENSVGQSAAQAAEKDDAVSAAELEIAAAPDSGEAAVLLEDNNLAADSETVVPETVAAHSYALDTESIEKTAEKAEEASVELSDQFGEIEAEASADFELIDLDPFDHVDIKLGDGFEIEEQHEDGAIAQADDAIKLDEPATHHFAATRADDASDSDETIIDTEADSEDSTHAIRARAFRAMLHDDNALEALPQESRAAIGKVLPPVELLSGVERHWGRRIALLLACLVLGAALAAQFLWKRLPVYSRTAEWRPVYEFACQIIACELPVYSEISALRSDNLVVRSHPTVANALTVSLSFRNTARFPQPFPVVILSFNSATNAIIALREFAPTEYLDVGLRDVSMMPLMSPVQIEIEVMDPGADAVNYTVAFRRP